MTATANPSIAASPAWLEGAPSWLIRDLRSDHAGENGAVAIYRGILAASRDAQVRAFARGHLRTEQKHLELLEDLLPPRLRSRFGWLWRLSGYLTGALPALLGAKAVYATIDAVESFVDRHYAEQIMRLPASGPGGAIRDLLETCRRDEAAHRDEARELLSHPNSPFARAWRRLVSAGSAFAVIFARRI